MLEGHSVLRRYSFGVRPIFHNFASVPIQSGTQFYAASQFGRGDAVIVPLAHSRGRSGEVFGSQAFDCCCRAQDECQPRRRVLEKLEGDRGRARHDPGAVGCHDRWQSRTCQSIVSYSTFCAWRLSRSASLKRAEAPEGMRGGLRSNHRGISGGIACGWRLE
jgi:hypothetical protein